MGVNFGVLALKNRRIEELQRLCDDLEAQSWFSDYMIFCGNKQWNSIYDEYLEWGSIDTYIEYGFSKIETPILSVEYDENKVRYRLWEQGKCIDSAEIRSNGRVKKPKKRKIFSEVLQVSMEQLDAVFRLSDPENNLMLMEGILQCQLWCCGETAEEGKILDSKCPTETEVEDFFIEEAKGEEEKDDDKNDKRELVMEAQDSFHMESIKVTDSSYWCMFFEHPIVYKTINGMDYFFIIDEHGQLSEIFKAPLGLLSGWPIPNPSGSMEFFGFFNTRGQFVLYQNGEIRTKFSDIHIYKGKPWYLYMADQTSLFMNWSCYSLETGQKQWDFPVPSGCKPDEKMLRRHLWKELPNGLFLLVYSMKREVIFLMIMDKDGNVKKSVKRAIKPSNIFCKVHADFIYFILSEDTRETCILLYNLELEELRNYRCSKSILNRRLLVDCNREYFYLATDNGILRGAIKGNGIQEISIWGGWDGWNWGLLQDDIFYFFIKKEIFFLKIKEGPVYLARYKIKGTRLTEYILPDHSLLIVSETGREKNNLYLQRISCQSGCGVNVK